MGSLKVKQASIFYIPGYSTWEHAPVVPCMDVTQLNKGVTATLLTLFLAQCQKAENELQRQWAQLLQQFKHKLDKTRCFYLKALA